jgi:hypothetical protein
MLPKHLALPVRNAKVPEAVRKKLEKLEVRVRDLFLFTIYNNYETIQLFRSNSIVFCSFWLKQVQPLSSRKKIGKILPNKRKL